MASYTPNLNLVLPIGVEKVSRAIINSNNTIIDGAIGGINTKITPVSLGASTLAGVKTALINLNSGMTNYTDRAVYFALSSTDGVFTANVPYIGILHRQDANNFSCNVQGKSGQNITLGYDNGTWTIDSPKDEVATLNSNLSNFTNNGISKRLSNIDLNTVITNGHYYISQSCTNRPSVDGGGFMDVIAESNQICKQIFYDRTKERLFTRTMLSQVWTSWEEFALNSNITTWETATPTFPSGATDTQYTYVCKNKGTGESFVELYITFPSGLGLGEAVISGIQSPLNNSINIVLVDFDGNATFTPVCARMDYGTLRLRNAVQAGHTIMGSFTYR